MPAARRIYKVKALPTALTKTRRTKLPSTTHSPTIVSCHQKSAIRQTHYSTSCTELNRQSVRQYSTWPTHRSTSHPTIAPSNNIQGICRRAFATCDAKCPCPFPCGPCGCKSGCGCLPPPCNTPPKCLQYMTGYYYYPYGTWFCGPYHVAGTCCPVGANGPPCPCPCPPKCCPACVCPAPGQADRNASDLNQFPVEVPCQNMSKSPNESRTGISKFFNFNAPDKKDGEPKQKKPMPPVLASMMCTSLQETSELLHREPRITSSYPVSGPKQRARFYHTNAMSADSSAKGSVPYKQKNWRYSYYQKRHKVVTPLERTRVFLKENKNRPRAKIDSVNYSTNNRRRDPRPDVDLELKPYDS